MVDLLFVSKTKQRLTIDLEGDFRPQFEKLKDGDVNVEIKKYFPARGLSANAYAWVLLQELAVKTGRTPTETYRWYIREHGCKTTYACVSEEDMESEVRAFLDGHIGRLVDIKDSKLPGCVVLVKRWGSSDYDTKQMSTFLNSIVEDCIGYGIEVRPPEEIKSMMEEFDKHGRN
jgi:hypothetical protein